MALQDKDVLPQLPGLTGRDVKLIRTARLITQRDLAKRAGMPGSKLCLLENGLRIQRDDEIALVRALWPEGV